MAHLITLDTFSDKRGALTVIEKVLPFDIKRVFYIYGVDDSVRGQHRHHKTIQAAVCVSGSCIISNDNGEIEQDFVLDSPEKCLILEPRDYHSMHHFTPDSILLVLASEHFDESDYIFQGYK